jgi:YegS/Rv2252/BmrU family lipid kinase
LTKKILFLINDHAGNLHAGDMASRVEQTLSAQGYSIETVRSTFKGSFIKLIPEIHKEFDLVAVFGGDGTMHEVINGLMQLKNPSDIDVMLFPCGTGNAFDHDLNCLTEEEAVRRIIQRKKMKIDVMRIHSSNRKIFSFNVTGWGLVSQINRLAERLRWMGDSRYTIAALISIFKNPSQRATIKINEHVFEDEFSFVLICNTKHTGKGMKMAPDAILNDGMVDVLMVRKVSFWKLLLLFPKIYSGKHIHSPLLQYIQTKKLEILCKDSSSVPLLVDGEIIGNCPFTLEVVPQSISVITF